MDISVVVPVYNEEECIAESVRRLKSALEKMTGKYEIILVNDGSRDGTMGIIEGLASNDKTLKVISFSRNFGHQSAVSAGMKYASGDCVVIIDADLQDPPELIPAMYEKFRQGYEIVYGKRTARKGEGFFKLLTARIFYKIINKLTNNLIPMDTGDFRLLGRKAVDVLNSMPEHARFLRGMGGWTGFSQYPFLYERDKRFAGKTKYSFKKMFKLASDGIFSFSYAPLVLPYILGLIMKTAGFVWLIVLLCMRGRVPAWQPVVAFMLLVGGIILLSMGIIGTYIARIYEEAKGRPLYIIDKMIGF